MRTPLLILALLVATSAPLHAEPQRIYIGLYAPTAPFSGPTERLDFVTRLAEHLSTDQVQVTGRVFTQTAALVAATKRGEIHLAVLDAPYAAARGLPYRILAAAVRNGSSASAWQLVTTGSLQRLGQLRGKTVTLPRIGAGDAAFLTYTLLESEVEPSFFGKIQPAPDSLSAATMAAVGRADAAFVPAGIPLPGNLRVVASLRPIGWPMLCALPNLDPAVAEELGKRARSFRHGGPFSGFGPAEAGNYRSLRFRRVPRKGLMAVPKPARLAVRSILAGREFRIPETDVKLLMQHSTQHR
jgi:hypothetical protein